MHYQQHSRVNSVEERLLRKLALKLTLFELKYSAATSKNNPSHLASSKNVLNNEVLFFELLRDVSYNF
jgi:hypothetical protein